MKQIVAIVVAFLLLVTAAGILWLANAHLMPPPQKIEQAIPDEHIPR